MIGLKSFDFDSLNEVMMDLVRSGKVYRYYISKKVGNDNIYIKQVTVTSQMGSDYTIDLTSFKNDYRDFRLNSLLYKNK